MWKFFTVEVNPAQDGDCDALIAFQTLRPATEELVENWVWEGSRGFSVRLRQDDEVLVTELTMEEFNSLTLGQITGLVVDNARR